jgi:hypothetical protein
MPFAPHRFVPHGTQAPRPLPAGEVWLDLGGRCEGLVFDHHRTGSGDSSALEAVWMGWKALMPLVGVEPPPTLVLHRVPDLDAISSAWLAGRVLRDGNLPASARALDLLVRAVSDHDQGRGPSGAPERDWAAVVSLCIALERSDEQRYRVGLELLDRSYDLLAEGNGLEEVAPRIVPERAAARLGAARRHYQEDKAAGRAITLRLPSGEGGIPREVHGLALHNPRSVLFKQLARADKDAPGGAGWSLLVVSRSVPEQEGAPSLWRHVVSVDPDSGYQLGGLGPHLDMLERTRWPGEPELPAWYDGRGHGFTIVDSPALRVGGQDLLGSRLTPAEVLGAVVGGAWIRAG